MRSLLKPNAVELLQAAALQVAREEEEQQESNLQVTN